MRLLTISDEVAPSLYQPAVATMLGPVDLILSCGDLPPWYLEFLVTMIPARCYYVRGNHDDQSELREDGSSVYDPGGWSNLDLRCVAEGGLLIAGVEGSLRYNRREVQYTERAMALRLWRLVPRLLLNKQRYGRYLDILITHAPPQGIHDGPGVHRGFGSVLRFMRRFQPRYLIHGHVHPRYRMGDQSPIQVGPTMVINTCGYQILEVEPL